MSFASPMAHFYDVLNDGVSYAEERDFLLPLLPEGARRGADLGCGTGELVCLLSRDYEMTGVDLSEEMLAAADEKAFSAGRKIRFVRQDIAHLALGEKFDFCVCLHDTLNYLLTTAEVSSFFAGVRAHLVPGGVFIFDLNTPERFRTEYGTGAEVLEREGLFCVWEKEYREKSGILDVTFHFFEEKPDGRYERSAEYERQRKYSARTVEKLCREAGLVPELVRQDAAHSIYRAVNSGEETELCR